MPTTEVLSVPFNPDSDPKVLLDVVAKVPAVGTVFYGFVSGKEKQFRAFLDWDSIEAFRAFQASEIFPPFLEDFKRVTAGPPSLWHVEFQPSLEAQHKAQSAPVTEVVTFYFASPPPAGFIDQALAFRKVLVKQPGFVEVALGVTHQEVQFEGEMGYPLVVLVGWKSEEDWKAFAEGEEYEEKNPGRSLKEGVLTGFEMEVVSLKEFEG